MSSALFHNTAPQPSAASSVKLSFNGVLVSITPCQAWGLNMTEKKARGEHRQLALSLFSAAETSHAAFKRVCLTHTGLMRLAASLQDAMPYCSVCSHLKLRDVEGAAFQLATRKSQQSLQWATVRQLGCAINVGEKCCCWRPVCGAATTGQYAFLWAAGAGAICLTVGKATAPPRQRQCACRFWAERQCKTQCAAPLPLRAATVSCKQSHPHPHPA